MGCGVLGRKNKLGADNVTVKRYRGRRRSKFNDCFVDRVPSFIYPGATLSGNGSQVQWAWACPLVVGMPVQCLQLHIQPTQMFNLCMVCILGKIIQILEVVLPSCGAVVRIKYDASWSNCWDVWGPHAITLGGRPWFARCPLKCFSIIFVLGCFFDGRIHVLDPVKVFCCWNLLLAPAVMEATCSSFLLPGFKTKINIISTELLLLRIAMPRLVHSNILIFPECILKSTIQNIYPSNTIIHHKRAPNQHPHESAAPYTKLDST